MLIREKTGNVISLSNQLNIDWLPLEWHETQKRIQRKRTEGGKEITLKFLKENPDLTQGDILFSDGREIIAVKILPSDCLVIEPKNSEEIAAICYEIGNRHLPLFLNKNELLTPFEKPLFRLLLARGYSVKQESRVMTSALKTTTIPHGHVPGTRLFDAIMELTKSKE